METDEKNNDNTSHNITIQQHDHDEQQGIQRVEMKDMSHSQLANQMH